MTTGEHADDNPFQFSTKYCDVESGLVFFGYRYYAPGAGRWCSRDPIGEDGGANLLAPCGNDPIGRHDVLGQQWVVTRAGQPKAMALPISPTDTFDQLGVLLHLDASDYREWADTTDVRPVPCKAYRIPNTVHIHFGPRKRRDYGPTSFVAIWRRQSRAKGRRLSAVGYRVHEIDNVYDHAIQYALRSSSTYGYVFVGHGTITTYYADGSIDESGGTINAYQRPGTAPDRYTAHGLAWMDLRSCGSLDPWRLITSAYTYNPWQYNVARRGLLTGYRGSVNALNEPLAIRRVRGTNTQ